MNSIRKSIRETPLPAMAEVYLLTNKHNGKQYVGCTTRPWPIREDDHMRASRHPKKRHGALARDFARYGRNGFIHETLATVRYEDAGEVEAFYIEHFDTLNTPHGYNRTVTHSPPHMQSVETRKKLRRINLAKLKLRLKNAA